MPTLLTRWKAASGRPLLRGPGVAGVPSSGHASKRIPHEPRRALAGQTEWKDRYDARTKSFQEYLAKANALVLQSIERKHL